MTDPLRRAAQALLDRWNSPRWDADLIRDLRFALDAPPSPTTEESSVVAPSQAEDERETAIRLAAALYFMSAYHGDDSATVVEAVTFLRKLGQARSPLPVLPEAPRGTDAQILKERELTSSAIQGAIAFGALGKDGPPDDELNAQWLKPFWELGRRQQRLEAVCRAAKACTDNPRMAGYQGGSLWLRLEAAVQALEAK